MPQGERRDIALRGEGEQGGGAGYCSKREHGEFGLEELPRGQRREQGEAAGDCSERRKGEFALEDVPPGERRGTDLRSGAKQGEAAGDCSERLKGELGLEELPQGAPHACPPA